MQATLNEKKFDEVLKEGIESYLLKKGIKNFNSAKSADLGNALTEFYLKEIGQYLYPFTEDETDDGICDSSRDCGIDFIYNSDEEWFIFQFKYKGNANSINHDEIAGFFNIHSHILDEIYIKNHAHKRLKELLYDFKKDHNVQYFLISNSRISEKNKNDFEKLQHDYESKYENVKYELKGFSDLKIDFKSVISNNEAISEEVNINIETLQDTFTGKDTQAYFDLSSAIDKNKKYKSILCTVKGTTLRSLWEEHRARLFNYNIRGFLGDNAINNKMKETLDNEPDKFYFYNNGISAICTELSPKLNEKGELIAFRCQNFSIINGAQTTTTIGRYKNNQNLAEVRVLLKITKAEDYKKEKGLNRKIITYNNSQTIIKASDFRSNDEIQQFMSTKLKEFTFKGIHPYRTVRYLRKRLKVEKRKDLFDITIEGLARALYVFEHDPILIFKAPKELFDPETKSGGKYWIVFGDEGKETEVFTKDRLEKTIAVYFLWYKIDEKIKSNIKEYKANKDESPRYRALIAKWHFLWAYGFILRKFHKEEMAQIFKKIADGREFEKAKGTFIDAWFEKIHNVIAKCLAKKYQVNTSKKAEEIQSFDFKNWLRNSSDFEELEIEFEYSSKSDFPLS